MLALAKMLLGSSWGRISDSCRALAASVRALGSDPGLDFFFGTACCSAVNAVDYHIDTG